MSSDDNPYQFYEYETDPNREPLWTDSPRGSQSLQSYVDPSTITTILIVLLITAIIVDCLGAFVSSWEAVVLRNIQSGAYETQELMQAAAESSDARVSMIGILELFAALISGIVFLVWTYRVCKNAHALSSAPLSITPVWAVVWYFVPIANLVMPYNALRQAFLASCRPDHWQIQQSTPLILFWWLIHVLGAILGQLSFRMALRLDDPTIEQLLTLNGVQISGDVVGILANILTLVIVQRFARCQREAYEQKVMIQDL